MDTLVFRRTLDEFKRDLKDGERLDFEYTTLHDLQDAIDLIQSQQASERKMRNLGRLKCILEAFEQYGKVIEVFLNTSEFVAFIWVSK
jgi:hypothetical protein